MDDPRTLLASLVSKITRVEGVCKPTESPACSAPVTARDLEANVASLLKSTPEIEYLVAVNPKNIGALQEKDKLQMLQAFFLDESVGMVHWKSKNVVMYRTSAFRKAIQTSEFKSGEDYGSLVAALEKQGLKTLDIEFTY